MPDRTTDTSAADQGASPGGFTHLHVHTEYSLLDGLSRLEALVARAAELGMDSLAITDHGGLYGAIDFYRIARKYGIKPIIGCEVYVAVGSRHSRDPSEKRPYHMTVLARSEVGYNNLVKLVTRANLEGFYHRARIDRELLAEYGEGLIVLSGCLGGEVPQAISEGRLNDAREAALWYREHFEDYYLELMRHEAVPALGAVNDGLIALSGELDIPLVATNDSHYVRREDAQYQDILICIHTNTNTKDPSRLRFEGDSYYLKSPGEMAELFADVPEAVANTRAIAAKCHLELDFDTLRLPQFHVPDGLTAHEYLSRLCRQGLSRRLPDAGDAEIARLEYELDVIYQTQFPNYFLVVWDIARFVREEGIFFAVRGSAAASLVLFCLGVTDINPLEFGLVFERFLNLERKEMPDIDMDFQDDRRDEVINYVVERYGSDHVAQIVTFGTLGARAAIRDSGRALSMSYGDVDRVARLVPQRLNISLREALDSAEEMAQLYREDEDVRRLIDTAVHVEGLVRHTSTHAAGVVISKEPLGDYVPLQRPVKGDQHGVNTTQYSMDPLAELGLLKMDFLGLANLTILARAIRLLKRSGGESIELSGIPLDDAGTFELLARGETVGVFQMEGAGMTRHIQGLRPSSLRDVAAMIALYRPGPMEHIDTFINAKHGRVAPEYPHPDLEEILHETYGVIVYQDQVLHIARKFAGYSLGEADIVRKAMGKKNPEIMAEERVRFIDGARAQGYSEEVAERVFALVEPFAGYAFNKAHSVSYALIAYWTAYFKANYPGEYMVSLLNGYMGNTDKVSAAVAECARMGISVRGPDVNEGEVEFSLRHIDGNQTILFGMASVKNVGAAAVEPLAAARREHGPFAKIEEMCRSADLGGLNRKALESLIRAGALDCFGDRTSVLSVAGRIISLAHSEAELRDSSQTTMFDMFGESVDIPLPEVTIEEGSTAAWQMGAWESELLGVDLSALGSVASLAASLGPGTILSREAIRPEMGGEKIRIAGQIQSVTNRVTRNDRPYAIANIKLLGGDIDVFVFEELLESTQGIWQQGKVAVVAGTVRDRGEDRLNITATSAAEHVAGNGAVPGSETAGSVDTLTKGDAAAGTNGASPPSGPADPGVGGNVPQAGLTAPAGGQPRSDQALREAGGSGDGELSGQEQAAAPPGPSSPSDSPPPEPVSAGGDAQPDAPRGRRRLSLRIVESDQPGRDERLLRRVAQMLVEHRGEDEVGLEIAAAERVVQMNWPSMRVSATEELVTELGDLLGESGQVSVLGR